MRELHTVAHHLTSKEGAFTEVRLAMYRNRLGQFRINASSMRFAASCLSNVAISAHNRRRSALCTPRRRPTNHGRSHPKKRASSWQQTLKITWTHPVSVVGRLTNLVCAAKPQRLNTSGWET